MNTLFIETHMYNAETRMSTLINHPILCINIWYFLLNFFI